MNLNWVSICNEMKVLNYITEYLELEDSPEIAVIIGAEMNKCGSLTQAMQKVIETMKEIAAEDNELNEFLDEDKEEEDEDVD